jgi:hypothetical protein
MSWKEQIVDDKMSNGSSDHPLQSQTQNVDYNDAKYLKHKEKELKYM